MRDHNITERVHGKAEEIGGSIKKTTGRIFGDGQMEVEGELEKLDGKVRQQNAKANERTRGQVEEVSGKLKNAAGHVLDNQQMEAEGKIKELTGKARQKANQ